MVQPLVVGDRATASVIEKKQFGVIVKIGDGPATALVHVSRLGGCSQSGRARRLQKLQVGDKLTLDIVEIKGEGKARKISASELRTFSELVANELKPGMQLKATLVSTTEFGAFARLQEGPAAGLDGLVHVSEFPGWNRDERDANLKAVKNGQEATVEVISASLEGDGVRLSLSLRGDERRKLQDLYAVGTVHTGRVVKRAQGGFVVSFGRLTGFLPESCLGTAKAGSIRLGGNVKSKVESVDARLQLTLTRRGI